MSIDPRGETVEPGTPATEEPAPASAPDDGEGRIVATFLARITLREQAPDDTVVERSKAPTIENLENALETNLWAAFGLDARVSAERTDT